MNKFYDLFYANYWWLLPAIFIFSFCIPLGVGVLVDPAKIYAILMIHVTVFFFAQKQALADRRLVSQVVRQLNQRFADLQLKMTAVHPVEQDHTMTEAQAQAATLYLSTCAEAYHHYTRQHIPNVVWESWLNQMRIYYYNPKIRALWNNLLKHDTHFGFGVHLLK